MIKVIRSDLNVGKAYYEHIKFVTARKFIRQPQISLEIGKSDNHSCFASINKFM